MNDGGTMAWSDVPMTGSLWTSPDPTRRKLHANLLAVYKIAVTSVPARYRDVESTAE